MNKIKKKVNKKKKPCMVFLLCTNQATTTMSHPILGKVPACKRCKNKLENL